MSHAHHGGGTAVAAPPGSRRFALVGSPNSGKSTLFNALTKMRTKTGNYPGVTVSRCEGSVSLPSGPAVVEDLPGTYSLEAISPDEAIVADVLSGENPSQPQPDAIVLTADSLALRRSLHMVAQTIALDLPTVVVVTFVDELARRGGSLDVVGLSRALGVPVVPIAAGSAAGVAELKDLLDDPQAWSRPPVLPPVEPAEFESWSASVLEAANYREPQPDQLSAKVDAVLLHPLAGSVIFFAVIFLFFQALFSWSAPLMDAIEALFGWLGGLVSAHVPGLAGRFLSEAIIGGVGGVLVFLPQITLLFLMISVLEGTGYMARAALLMDRVMGTVGLEGRAFVALLSSLACAIPGIMATRTLPSARDRLATMMAAPLMTCSARLPVYTLLIALLVPHQKIGPVGLQGLVMFVLYIVGAMAAMLTAGLFGRIAGRTRRQLPFYMEMPPYRRPRLRSIALTVWEPVKAFIRKVGKVILVTAALLWVALSLPLHTDAEMRAAGVDTSNEQAVTQYQLQHSAAAAAGKAIEPVFEPLGFDWRINVGVLASLSAREVFVATMGQIAAADDPEDPQGALVSMTRTEGPHAGEKLFTPGTVAALLMFFTFALQCFATVGVMRRETGGWKWPAIAFGYMFALAWTFGWLANVIVTALV